MVNDNQSDDRAETPSAERLHADHTEVPVLGPRRGGRAIVLFSDGTGNSSAKLFKTNVWRMYEAIELGATSIDAQQIVYYDEGVGNSGFRPLAVLGGVFGYGLKRNVLDLYGFLCRNYRDDDRIFIFGFSRGAFTARVLAGLIARQGLVPYRSETDLARQVRGAYRAYSGFRARPWPPMSLVLWLWRMLVTLVQYLLAKLPGRHPYDREQNRDVRIRFIGVWDTVAAYGGPIIELVRAFDDWIRPLSFKDQRLSDKIDRARQALALDDERDAFQPVPWDEPYPPDRERLKQVWFSGMHADVGGGYPDDSLAYVSLAWMMEEAADAGLVLRPDKVADANRTANALGPIHDSRSGLGAYYRYQPRLVGAYVQPPPHGTESIEDPQFRHQGLQPRVWVHESVLHRIAAGTDGYAPITLPEEFAIVDHSLEDTSFPRHLSDNLAATATDRADRQETLRNRVWVRRGLYFGTVASSVALASMPLWADRAVLKVCADSRCVLGDIYSGVGQLLPDFTKRWIGAFSTAPSWTTLFIALILLFITAGTLVERGMRDGSRKLWHEALGGQITTPKRFSLLRAMRTSRPYQGILGALKWHVVPAALGLLMLVAIAWSIALAAAQLRLSIGEGGDLFCKATQSGQFFRVDAPCNDLGMHVERGRTYLVRINVVQGWKDGEHAASPLGLPASSLGPTIPWVGTRLPLGELAAPFRRVVRARYLQPLAEISEAGRGTSYITVLQFRDLGGGEYLARFEAPRTGRLRMFANEAVPPWPWPADLFYRTGVGANTGSALVTVE